MSSSPTAAILIIGNEILSGRTHDLNLPWLGEQLNLRGIPVNEARIVADDEAQIIEAVNTLRARYTYVFTTGGIGPTHDDITAACMAKAFDTQLCDNAKARALLESYYGVRLNESRLRMARIPEGAALIDNPVSAAPGFRLENVYVMAGIPKIMQAMFHGITDELQGGSTMQSMAIDCHFGEGDIAAPLGEIQNRHADVSIGSYPACRPGEIAVSIVLRHTDRSKLITAGRDVGHMIENLRKIKTNPQGQ